METEYIHLTLRIGQLVITVAVGWVLSCTQGKPWVLQLNYPGQRFVLYNH